MILSANQLKEASIAAATEMMRLSDGEVPAEVFSLDATTASIVIDIKGVDFILTISKLPVQRPRPKGPMQ